MYSKFILQIFLLSQLADLQCGMATIRKLQFRFACDSEHFRPFGFKFFIFRHIFFSTLVFLYWIYTAAGIYGTGGGRFGESLPLPHRPAANNPTAVLYMPQTGIRGMRPLPHMPAANNPTAVLYMPQTGATRKIRAKASCR